MNLKLINLEKERKKSSKLKKKREGLNCYIVQNFWEPKVNFPSSHKYLKTLDIRTDLFCLLNGEIQRSRKKGEISLVAN